VTGRFDHAAEVLRQQEFTRLSADTVLTLESLRFFNPTQFGVIAESSRKSTLSGVEEFRAGVSQRAELVSEWLGGPDVVAVKGDVFPTERRDVT